MIYRGSRDGFKDSDFHRKCDGQGATVSIIKTISSDIIGGFTSQSWQSGFGWIEDD